MQALEVGHVGVIAGVHQRLEAGLHELGGAAAEDRLLAEQVGLGLVLERRLDHPGASAADPPGIREHQVAGVARLVLVHGHQARDPAPLGELAADQVAGSLRGDHADVDAGRWLDLAEVDREPVGEHEQVPGADPVPDLGLPGLGLRLVREQDHHDVAPARRLADVEDGQPLALGVGAARRAGPQADHAAGVLEVQRVGVTLRAVAQDRDRLPLEVGEVGGVVVVDAFACHGAGLYAAGRFMYHSVNSRQRPLPAKRITKQLS